MASILPTDQDFDAGATVFGAQLTGYIASGFWTGQAISAIILNDTVGVQPLHDGYRAGPASLVNRQATFASTDVGEKSGGVQMREPYTADDVTVSMTQYGNVLNGTVTNPDAMIKRQFVGARISGGTQAAGASPPTTANPQRITNVDAGYFFGYTTNSVDAYWSILKVGAGGAVTILKEQIFSGSGAFTEDIDPLSAHKIEMTVVDSGADVVITGSVYASTSALSADAGGTLTKNKLNGPFTPWSPTTGGGGTSSQEVISVTDLAAATPHQTAGRCGLISTAVHGLGMSSGGAVATMIQDFTVTLATGPVVYRDEFLPWDRRAGQQWSGTGFDFLTGQKAYDLRCGWSGDRFGSSTANGEILRLTAGGHADRIGAADTGATETTGGFYASMRPAGDDVTSHRRVQIQFSNADIAGAGASYSYGAGEFRQAGLFARADSVSAGVPQNAYSVDIRPTENSLAAWVKLRRWNDGVETTIAELLTPTIGKTIDYTLALRVYNLPDGQGVPQNGIVSLEAYLDGVLVVLTDPAAGVVSGVQVSSAGTVFDASSEKISSGTGEGIRIAGVAGSDWITAVDAWTELAIEVTPGTGVGDQLNASVSDEEHDYTATELVIKHDWPVSERRRARRHAADFDSGHVRVSLVDLNMRRVWNVTAQNTTVTERDTLVAFFDARRGIEEAFDWTAPLESSTTKVHFVDPELGDTLKVPGVSSFNFELEEIL